MQEHWNRGGAKARTRVKMHIITCGDNCKTEGQGGWVDEEGHSQDESGGGKS